MPELWPEHVLNIEPLDDGDDHIEAAITEEGELFILYTYGLDGDEDKQDGVYLGPQQTKRLMDWLKNQDWGGE